MNLLPLLSSVSERQCHGRIIGAEREYEIHRNGARIDARQLWSTLEGLGAALDPGDRNARRGPSGGVLTTDGWEAEVVTPPVSLAPGFTHRVLEHASAGARHLQESLPRENELHGYSTHISVEVDDRHAAAIAKLIARRLSLPLMLALDRRGSPGLLVRPRHNRLEIGGEFVAGRQLRAAVSLAVAVVLLAERAVDDRSVRRRLRDLPTARVVPATERFGWFVDRRAFGPDLYAEGRKAILHRRARAILAGDALSALWDVARPHGAMVLAADELDLVDCVVAGTEPIPLDAPIDDDGPVDPVRTDRWYGRRDLDQVCVSVAAATWLQALLEVRSDERVRWLIVPGRALDAVLDGLDRGELAAEIASLVCRSVPTPT